MVVQGYPLCLTQLPRIACIHLTEQRCARVRDHSLDLIADNELFKIGHLQVTALHVHRHTSADVADHVNDMVFLGDMLFMTDIGSAHCDFPGGTTPTTYRSGRRLLGLPGATRYTLPYLTHIKFFFEHNLYKSITRYWEIFLSSGFDSP